MDDLISRQTAIDALNKLKIYRPLDSDRYVISDCLNKIVNLPSAQPERKKGRIIYAERNTELWGASAICGICGCSWQIDENGYDNFCPNCGADMRDPLTGHMNPPEE